MPKPPAITRITVTLTFDDGTRRTLEDAPVRDAAFDVRAQRCRDAARWPAQWHVTGRRRIQLEFTRTDEGDSFKRAYAEMTDPQKTW